MFSKGIKIALSFVLVSVIHATAFGQGCANCKTAVESDLATGGAVGSTLNNGILYLMAIPYVILALGAYFFFKKPIDAKIRGWKNRLLGS
jgi:hypothetical protein